MIVEVPLPFAGVEGRVMRDEGQIGDGAPREE